MSATTQFVQDVDTGVHPGASTGPGVRLRIRLHRRRLDHELACGIDPNSDPLHRERARELVGERCRHRLAATLGRVLAEADSPAHRFTSKVPLARAAIRDSRAEMNAIVERLESAYISARGVAMISVLLCDGSGPLFGTDPTDSRILHEALEAVIDCLDNGPALVG